MKKRQALFVLNEPGALRISPALAREIGFNESIFLLQIEYLIGSSNTEEKDGKLWTYQSLQHLKDEYFPWWSTATLSRIARNLEQLGLIFIGNYNKVGYDRTQWYALNEQGINRLNSIKLDNAILQNEKSKRAKRKMDTDKLQNRSAQIETPIPETPTKTPTETPTEGEPPTWETLELNEILNIPEIALFRKITGRIPGRPQFPIIWETIHQHGFTVDDLTPYWKAWATKGYRSEDLSWLVEWAVKKQIPSINRNGQSKPSESSEARYVEVYE